MKAFITFDGNLHVEAATLQHIQGKVLAGCLPWQKILCHFDAFLMEDSSTGKEVGKAQKLQGAKEKCFSPKIHVIMELKRLWKL
ncbi:ATP-dependent RNA helicase DEAH12, chloroplastic-like protein isoform X2 [Cinnamomum micranthum f. kanehirae]|uniref:ATP-dependent RNA helicase DEAH12, chloroplastic-like protein isoform X2 n=1 Tax=Cinnamomum micranthum f. kanehirae TaxID=337451 RepID=A0A3S4PGR7_9MAGN|nr:ATP-dependent RNA helicase DEAH12, chloroplastic-like protein isoform X2 [Cinnamomum micranthum f. kanehirae]